MAKLLVYLDDERHTDLKELAHRNKTTMADLIRFALEEVFEDQLDALRGERRLAEAADDSSESISWEDYKAEHAGRVRTSA